MTSPVAAQGLSTPAEAFVAIALAAVACDGDLAALEARALRQSLEYRHPYCTYSDEAMVQLLDRLLLILREQGGDALVEQAVPLLQPAQRETALAVAADLTRADHVETSDERQFLASLATRLGLSEERSATILEVIAVLNSDSLAS